MARQAKVIVTKPDELNPWDLHGGWKELTSASCALTFILLYSGIFASRLIYMQ